MKRNSFISSSDNDTEKNGKKNFAFFFVKFFLFILCLIPVIYYIGKTYSSASTENLINTYNEKRWKEFYSLEKNSLDMVFLGSSHSYCTFDPDIFDKKLGCSSYQMGMPFQHPDSTYFTLLEFLKYQKPKVCVVEVYWDVLDDEFDLNQASMLFQVLNNEELEKKYINDVFPLGEKVRYNVDIFKYQKDYFAFRNKKLKDSLKEKFNVSDSVSEKQQGKEEYRSKGYTFCNYNMLKDEFYKTNQFRNFDGKNWTFDDTQKKYLKKIIDNCKKEDIKIILVTAPIANVSMDFIKNYNYVHSAVKNFADENEVPYIDYNIINKNENLLTNDNFRDDAHLNHSGVEIISSHFADYLKKNGYF